MTKRQVCTCTEKKTICKRPIACKLGGAEAIAATLEFEEYEKKLAKYKPPKFKVRKFKPLPVKQKMIPMFPPMYQRLKYLRHCDALPAERTYLKRPMPRYTENIMSSEDENEKKKRLKREKEFLRDQLKCNVQIPSGPKFVKHADSDVSIIHVPSPKVSGANVIVKRAPLKATELKPPLPAKSGFDLYKPHSGIIINRDKEYAVQGLAIGPGGGRKRKDTCAKGGVCTRKKCRRKKCRKYAAMRRRQMARVARTGKKGRERPCSARSGASSGGGGARDGKPRAQHLKSGVMPRDDTGCGLDDIERPEYPVVPAGLRKGAFRTHSLTIVPCTKDKRGDIHYGILMGNFNMFGDRFGKSRGRQGLPMSIMAYCLAYHYHPKMWNPKLIDSLLMAADQWYSQLLEKVHDHSAYQGICEVVPFGKQKVVVLNKKKMQVLLCEPEIVGYAMSLDPTVYNLCRGLKAFFTCPDTRACIMMTRTLKIAIWRDKVCFYVFDPAGRDAKAYSNFANGNAALINVLDLNSVIDILLARSIIEDQKFVLAPIKVLAMVNQTSEEDLESEPEPNQAEKAKMSYKILGQNLAIVNANMHLGDPMFQDTKFQQALTIAVAALTYAKISPPNTWYTKTLDKIIRLGNKLYLDFKHPRITFELGLDNIPNEIVIGPYTCEIIIYRDRTKGQLFTTKECILNIKTGLEDFFSHEYNSGIIDFNNYKIAVWRQKDMFYLFDPYPRTNDGLRAMKSGKACCLMLLNTEAMADAFTKNWDFLPATTQFYIHAFKVLKLGQRKPQNTLTVSLSATKRKRSKPRREVLEAGSVSSFGKSGSTTSAAGDGGGGRGGAATVMSAATTAVRPKDMDEEFMGEIISLVDSIQEDFIPPVPQKFKNAEPEPDPLKVHDLDSPTVSVTQVVPPWPKPRDKSNEEPDRDPDPEPTPPPTPPPPIPPEGAEEEEEEEEELDEEALKRKKEEEKRRKAEEEEARRKAEELPPPMPPPPPTPLLEDEGRPPKRRKKGQSAGASSRGGDSAGGGSRDSRGSLGSLGGLRYIAPGEESEIAMQEDDTLLEPVQVERYVLLTEDAKKRYKMRQQHKQLVEPVEEEEEAAPYIDKDGKIVTSKEHNFVDLVDSSQIIRGSHVIPNKEAVETLPFVAIMAVVTSYKYTIDTWSSGIVDFVVESGKKLSEKKFKQFQTCALHIIPRIAIGHDAYHANIDVVKDGPTWQLEHILDRAFFPKYDRGILTTPFYSCAIFRKNGLYYLYDGSECNAMGQRHLPFDDNEKHKSGKACFMRFLNLRDLVSRIQYNKNGQSEDSQFILSRLLVRRLMAPVRMQLPDDYDYATMSSAGKKSHPKVSKEKEETDKKEEKKKKKVWPMGYVDYDGIQRINGTTAVPKEVFEAGKVKSSHYVCLMALLTAAMHPLREWTSFTVDSCIESGQEIHDKATSNVVCEKRVIKNIVMDGRFINVNLKKIIVINQNQVRYLEQYMKAVLARLRYVLIRFNGFNLAVVQTNGVYNLFDPQTPPSDLKPEEMPIPKPEPIKNKRRRTLEEIQKDVKKEEEEQKKEVEWKKEKERKKKKIKEEKKEGTHPGPIPDVAGWTLYRTLDGLIARVRQSCASHGVKQSHVDNPEFYTFELTAVRPAPRHAMYNYKMSPLFRPDENPNQRFLSARPPRPRVDERLYWLDAPAVPWARSAPHNDRGVPRGSPAAVWHAWDIEFPGDLYSLWGRVHPADRRFAPGTRGAQAVACCLCACALVRGADLAAWTPGFLDGVVVAGDNYHAKLYEKLRGERNHEVTPEDYQAIPGEIYPFTFTVKVQNIIFGFLYNMLQDRFNLSNALAYFFEKHDMGLCVNPKKTFAFGKVKTSYFMFDCMSKGSPLFNKGAYILKCESLNRLIYCMTVAFQIRTHNQQFHLYSVKVDLHEMESSKMQHKPSNTDISTKSSKSNASSKSSKSSASSKSALSPKSSKTSTKSSKSSKSNK